MAGLDGRRRASALRPHLPTRPGSPGLQPHKPRPRSPSALLTRPHLARSWSRARLLPPPAGREETGRGHRGSTAPGGATGRDAGLQTWPAPGLLLWRCRDPGESGSAAAARSQTAPPPRQTPQGQPCPELGQVSTAPPGWKSYRGQE